MDKGKKMCTVLLVSMLLFGLLSGVSSGVIDRGIERVEAASGTVNILDYMSHPSEDAYAIYDVAGMEYLADLVNDEGVTFAGKTVNLEKDLKYDKNVVNNHRIIGKCEGNAFGGIFDGKNHTVSGLNINIDLIKDCNDTEYERCGGIFASIANDSEESSEKPQLKNLQLCDSVITDYGEEKEEWGYKNGDIGGIVGRCQGIIDNCSISDDVYIYGFYVSGIASENDKVISNCVNEGNLNAIMRASGICSYANQLENCINYGHIVSKNFAYGIGLSNKYIQCCNHGKIRGVIISYGLGGESNDEMDLSFEYDRFERTIINCYDMDLDSNVHNLTK